MKGREGLPTSRSQKFGEIWFPKSHCPIPGLTSFFFLPVRCQELETDTTTAKGEVNRDKGGNTTEDRDGTKRLGAREEEGGDWSKRDRQGG